MYQIDIENREMIKLQTVTFSQMQLKERHDLQEWIISNPSCLGEDLLILQKEFDGFDNTQERLDLLALDKQGNLVIIENKTDSSGKDVVWQSIKYASYCSRLTEEKIINIYAQYLAKYGSADLVNSTSKDMAKKKIYDFLSHDEDNELAINADEISQRIILVAMEFRPEVTSAVLWLMNFGIDIKCFKCQLFTLHKQLLFDMQQILPVAEVQSFMIDVVEKKKEEAKTLSNRKQVLLDFWKKFIDSRVDNFINLYSHRSPTSDNWLSQGVGVSGVAVVVVIAKNYAKVRLEINAKDKATTLELFNQIYSHKDKFEKIFTEDINWHPRPDGVLSTMTMVKDGLGYENTEGWQESIKYLIINSYNLQQLIKKILDDSPNNLYVEDKTADINDKNGII